MMNKEIKTAGDLLDDIYSLAFWMTGAVLDANKLVKTTFLHAKNGSSATELFKTFRACYLESYGNDSLTRRRGIHNKSGLNPADSLRLRFTDMKLSVLLSEIAGLKHLEISKITETSLETVSSWLSRGRKLFVNGILFQGSSLKKMSS